MHHNFLLEPELYTANEQDHTPQVKVLCAKKLIILVLTSTTTTYYYHQMGACASERVGLLVDDNYHTPGKKPAYMGIKMNTQR